MRVSINSNPAKSLRPSIIVMASEAALALLDTTTLSPLARHGGILTPATALGDVLVSSLSARGLWEIKSDVVIWNVHRFNWVYWSKINPVCPWLCNVDAFKRISKIGSLVIPLVWHKRRHAAYRWNFENGTYLLRSLLSIRSLDSVRRSMTAERYRA